MHISVMEEVIDIRKIFIIIFSLAAIIIALFIWFMSTGVDRNLTFYKTLVTYEDVVYKNADGQNLTLDILMPTEFIYDQVPVLFYVHDGSFIGGDKSDLTRGIGRELAPAILDAGYAIISLNYRLLNEVTHFPDNIRDVKDAIRYITSVAPAEEYNFDVDNFGLWGSGAGAYLALTAAYSPSALFLGDYELRQYSADVNYVIDFYGVTQISSVYDITTMTALELSEHQTLLNYLYGVGMDIYNLTDDDYETMASFDPLSFVSVDTLPTLIIHGMADEVVSIEQSILLRDRLNQYGIDYEYHQILGGNYRLEDIADTEKTNITQKVIQYLEAQYQTTS